MADIQTSGIGIFTPGELGVDAPQLNAIIGNAVIQPAFYSSKASGSSPGNSDVLLLLGSSGAFYQIPYSAFFGGNAARNASGLPQWVSTINGDFSVWQRGTTFFGLFLASSGTQVYLADRWNLTCTISSGFGAAGNVRRSDMTAGGSGNPPQLAAGVPNYQPRYSLLTTVSTPGTAIAAGDFALISQRFELRQARKLFGGVSSLGLWVCVSVAGTYSIVIQNADQSQTYKQDVNIATPNAWQRVTLPNIPIMPTGSGVWGTAETDFSYSVGIAVAAGTTFQSNTMSQWLSGNYLASAASSNPLLAQIANSWMAIWGVQHESGPICTPFQPDSDYDETRRKCQRYWAQSYADGNAAGTTGDNNPISLPGSNVATIGGFQFPQQMRVVPALNFYSPTSGTINKIRDVNGSADDTISSSVQGVNAVSTITLGAASGNGLFQVHYTANAEL